MEGYENGGVGWPLRTSGSAPVVIHAISDSLPTQCDACSTLC